MTQPINELMIGLNDANFYTPTWLQVLQDHIQWLQNSNNTNFLTVSPADSIRFSHDFFGLLTYKKIPSALHVPMLLVNGYKNPLEYEENTLTLLQPAESEINTIMQNVQNSFTNKTVF